jgi:hypothetical protein
MSDNTIELFGDEWTQKLAPNYLSERLFVIIEHSNKEAVAFFATVSALTMLDYNKHKKHIIKHDELISRIKNEHKSKTPYLICLENQKDWINSVINDTVNEKYKACTIEEILTGKV